MPPLVTVVVPTCNRPLLLRRALYSLLLQIDPPSFEIVVADGCPSPKTKAVVEDIARHVEKRGAEITYVARKTRGPSQTKNLGLEHARGKLIGILDDDNILLPYALTLATRVIDETGANIVVGYTVSTLTYSTKVFGVSDSPLQLLRYEDYLCGRVGGEFWGLINYSAISNNDLKFFPHSLFAAEKILYVQQWRMLKKVVYMHVPLELYEERTSSVTRPDSKGALNSRRFALIALDYINYLKFLGSELKNARCYDQLCIILRRLYTLTKLLGVREGASTALHLMLHEKCYRSIPLSLISSNLKIKTFLTRVQSILQMYKSVKKAKNIKENLTVTKIIHMSKKCYMDCKNNNIVTLIKCVNMCMKKQGIKAP